MKNLFKRNRKTYNYAVILDYPNGSIPCETYEEAYKTVVTYFDGNPERIIKLTK